MAVSSLPLLVWGDTAGASPTVAGDSSTLAGMTDTAPSQEETPTCRVRHFSPDPDDPKKLVGGAKIKTISRVGLPAMQAKGFAEVDADGVLVGEIPKADEVEGDDPPDGSTTEPEDDPPAATTKPKAKPESTASTGGKA